MGVCLSSNIFVLKSYSGFIGRIFNLIISIVIGGYLEVKLPLLNWISEVVEIIDVAVESLKICWIVGAITARSLGSSDLLFIKNNPINMTICYSFLDL